MWADQAAKQRHFGPTPTFFNAADGPVEAPLLSLGLDRGPAHSGGA